MGKTRSSFAPTTTTPPFMLIIFSQPLNLLFEHKNTHQVWTGCRTIPMELHLSDGHQDSEASQARALLRPAWRLLQEWVPLQACLHQEQHPLQAYNKPMLLSQADQVVYQPVFKALLICPTSTSPRQ